MAAMSKRLNITVPMPVYELARQVAEQQYEGNLSRMMADAVTYFAGRLEALEGSQSRKANK